MSNILSIVQRARALSDARLRADIEFCYAQIQRESKPKALARWERHVKILQAEQARRKGGGR